MNAIRIKRRLDSETLHLPELRPLIGREVEIVIQESSEAKREAPELEKPIWEQFQEVMAKVPENATRQLPTDGAAQHDHYLYGSPKKQP